MENPARLVLAFALILAMGVALSGCSDSTESTAQTPLPGDTTTAPPSGPLFTAGDIVQSSAQSSPVSFLIIGYDAAADAYTRALVYKNPDGTWGYRLDLETQTSKRSVMEKAYPVKVAHVSISAVPVRTPTTVPTTVVTTARTTVVTTATATTVPRPSIRDCDPEDGDQDEEIEVEIYGYSFDEDATCRLERSGESDIEGTDVDWISANQINCTFDIPDDAEIGAWTIVVINPGGVSGKLSNYFIIHGTDNE